MAKCDFCEKDMTKAKGCLKHMWTTDDEKKEEVLAPRVGECDHTEPGERCHDCNAKYGEYHHIGCDNEFCPRCGGQLILACECYTDDVIMIKEATKKELEERKAAEYYNALPRDKKIILNSRANIPTLGQNRTKAQKQKALLKTVVEHMKENGLL